MPPYVPHGTHDWVFADLEDPYPPNITSLPVEVAFHAPDDEPVTGWRPAIWHPDKPATVAYLYPGDLPAGWVWMWSRVNNAAKYRHGRIRFT